MASKMKSRKLWAFLVIALLVVLNSVLDLGVDADSLNRLLVVASSYLVGQGLADMGKK